MVDERDLYQEIELELTGAGPAEEASGGRGFLAFALTLFSLSLISLACVGGWIFLSETGAVPSVAVLLNGTATPLPTPTSLPIPTVAPTIPPIPTALPTDVVEAAAVASDEPLPTNTPEPTEVPLPTATPTATPLPWPPEIGVPVSSSPSIAGLTLREIGGQNPLRVLAELGHDGGSYLDEMQVVRAQTVGYASDTAVQADQVLLGSLPPSPLFLIVGTMEGAADFNGQTGLMRLKVPWSETTIKVNLSSALMQQVSNPSLVINSWPAESGWVWMLARSAELERALVACRSTLPSRSQYAMPPGEQTCDPLSGMLTTEVETDAVMVLGIENDGRTMRDILPVPTAPLIDRWIYADLGRHGLQLRTPAWLTDVLSFSGAREPFGLLRGTWNSDLSELSADMVLDADTIDGITQYILHWQEEPAE